MSDAWTLLYSATLASSFAYKDGFAMDEWMADSALAAGIEVERAVVEEIAADRGPITRDRWRRAALAVFEARLANGAKLSKESRARYEEHVEALRLDLGIQPEPPRDA